MACVRYLRAEAAPEGVAATPGKLPALHVYRADAHAQTAFRPWLRFAGSLLADLALDPSSRSRGSASSPPSTSGCSTFR
jgi:hypothetical protein